MMMLAMKRGLMMLKEQFDFCLGYTDMLRGVWILVNEL